jgi:hypothetical protein
MPPAWTAIVNMGVLYNGHCEHSLAISDWFDPVPEKGTVLVLYKTGDPFVAGIKFLVMTKLK